MYLPFFVKVHLTVCPHRLHAGAFACKLNKSKNLLDKSNVLVFKIQTVLSF